MSYASVAGAVAVLVSSGVYYGMPVSATVVDGATLKPLPGVHVVASWDLPGAGEGQSVSRRVKVLEAVTDKEGKFTLPAWGPRFAIPSGPMRDGAPEMILFMPGYKWDQLRNNERRKEVRFVARSDHDGATLTLTPLPTDPQRRYEELSRLESRLFGLLETNPCHGRSFPRMLHAFDEEYADLQAALGKRPSRWLAYAAISTAVAAET